MSLFHTHHIAPGVMLFEVLQGSHPSGEMRGVKKSSSYLYKPGRRVGRSQNDGASSPSPPRTVALIRTDCACPPPPSSLHSPHNSITPFLFSSSSHPLPLSFPSHFSFLLKTSYLPLLRCTAQTHRCTFLGFKQKDLLSHDQIELAFLHCVIRSKCSIQHSQWAACTLCITST